MEPRPRHVLVQGASRGIGRALVELLLARGDRVTATCRSPRDLHDLASVRFAALRLDLEDPRSIEAAAARIDGELDWVINVSGLLHDGMLQPEKKLDHVDRRRCIACFR